MMKIVIVLVTQILTIGYSSVYNVPSYYGDFSRNFFVYSKILSGRFRYFEYHNAVDADYNNLTVFYANQKLSCIQIYNLTSKRKQTFAGLCGNPGNYVGGIDVMQFKECNSVVYYQQNEQSKSVQASMQMRIVADSQCDTSIPGCILDDPKIISLNINNLRLEPKPVQFPKINPNAPEYLYVSDTGNHCIKRIQIKLRKSIVVAGECGSKGFMDGPQGFNRLNRPSSLGISRSGVLYFWDEANQYIRKVNLDGSVQTLLLGSCKQYGISRQINGYTLKNILCYDNWVETTTKAIIQHVLDPSEIKICLQHSSQCPQLS